MAPWSTESLLANIFSTNIAAKPGLKAKLKKTNKDVHNVTRS